MEPDDIPPPDWEGIRRLMEERMVPSQGPLPPPEAGEVDRVLEDLIAKFGSEVKPLTSSGPFPFDKGPDFPIEPS